jgi:hypothetical protein
MDELCYKGGARDPIDERRWDVSLADAIWSVFLIGCLG